MKTLTTSLVLLIGSLSMAHAVVPEGFALQYVKPIIIKILSNREGVTRKENFHCTPETCCFSERFYCFMTKGRCICDLHVCGHPPNQQGYWMEITGTEAERYCGRPRMLHKLTQLCKCDPDRTPVCNQCNPPPKRYIPGVDGLSLPQDCRLIN